VDKYFISHSAADFETVRPLVQLLEDGMGLDADNIVCSSLPGYGFDPGSPFRDEIRDSIASSKVVVTVISSAFLGSPYCMAEVGVAWSIGRAVLPLLVPGVHPEDVRGPLQGLSLGRLGDARWLDQLWEKWRPEANGANFLRWQTRRDQFLQRLESLNQGVKDIRPRGFWDGSIVDGSLSIAEELPSFGLRRQVLRAIENGHPLPPHLFYVTDQGLENWLALIDDPRFSAFQDSMELVADYGVELAKEISRSVRSQDLDIVSLGPGDGRKDVPLVQSIVRESAARGGVVFFYPYDINPNMVAKTMARVSRDPVLRTDLGQVKSVVAHFDFLANFKEVYQYRKGPNLLMLLGNMLGNFSDDYRFLNFLYSRAMEAEDLLLLEVRLRPDPSEDPVPGLVGEAWTTSRRFDYSPLELLGVPYDEQLMTYSVEADRGTIRGSDTIVGRYRRAQVDGRTFQDVDLSFVHRYDEKRLQEAIERVGFSVRRTWTTRRRSSIWLLLQKGDQS
jgi:Histidine-specific methyltransferase, SAM-dependent/TIR domain